MFLSPIQSGTISVAEAKKRDKDGRTFRHSILMLELDLLTTDVNVKFELNERPTNTPPNTHPHMLNPILSIDTNDWVWKANHAAKIIEDLVLLSPILFLIKNIAL